MGFFSTLLLALSSNLDDLAVGLALGLKGLYLPPWAAAVVALFSGLTILAGMLLGDLVSHLLAPKLIKNLSFILFLAIGLYFIYRGLREKNKVVGIKLPQPHNLSFLGALGLGLLLGIDSFVLGFPAGLADYSLFLTPFLAGASSFLFIAGGSRLGASLAARYLGDRGDLVAGSIFCLLAVLELL